MDAGSNDERPRVDLKQVFGCFLWMSIILATPLWLPFSPLFGPLLTQVFDVRERRFRRRMKDRGRFMDWEKLRPALETGDGTLIVEYGLKAPTRVWWTAINVLALAPSPPPSEREVQLLRHMPEPHSFVGWCHKRFLDDESGKAILTHPTDVPDGCSFARHFRERFPDISTIETVQA